MFTVDVKQQCNNNNNQSEQNLFFKSRPPLRWEGNENGIVSSPKSVSTHLKQYLPWYPGLIRPKSNPNRRLSVPLPSVPCPKRRFFQSNKPINKVIKSTFIIIIKNIIQPTLVISTSVISNNCLSRRENLVLVLTQKSKIRLQNIVEKGRNCS